MLWKNLTLKKPILKLKKIFVTIKLSTIDQSVFCANLKFMFPVPNKLVKQGWTHINLITIPVEICFDALKTSYELVSKKITNLVLVYNYYIKLI